MNLPNKAQIDDIASRIVVLPQGQSAAQQGSPAPAEGSGINFRYIAAAIRGNQKLIIVIFLSVLTAAILITMLQTPRYTSQTTIQINNSSDRVLKSQDDKEGNDAANSADTDRFLKTQVDIIKSRALALRVGQKLGLMHNPAFFKASNIPNPAEGTSEEDIARRVSSALRQNVAVGLPRDSRIVSIAYESANARLASDIANAYAAEFIQSNLKRKFDSSSYARDFVASQLDETKRKLQDSERALNAYARQTGLIRTTGGGGDGKATTQSGSVTSSTLMQVNQAANDARTKRIAAEARWNAFNSAPLLSSPELLSNGGFTQLIVQKSQIEAALEEERARHLDDYPTVKSKQAQLNSVNRQMTATATNVRVSIKSEFQAAAHNEAQLFAQVERLKGEMLNEQDRDVQYGLLAREVDTNRQVYDSLLQRMKELNTSSGISISNVSVIDVAEVPQRPSSPDLLKNLGISLALATMLCVLALVIKDQFDDSIRIPEDIETKLGLTLLGVSPHSSKDNPEEQMLDPKSPLSESYNSLRGALLYSSQGGLPHVLMITSAQAAEGKSTTSYALALSLARIGKKVLLIDADLRRPSLHRRIDADNAVGFSTLLTTHQSVASVAQTTEDNNLSVVTSGPLPPSPTELFSNARMHEVIEQARAQFDVVLIDTPPILGLADAPTIAAAVDGVLFVVEADRSRHGSLKAALRRLRLGQPNILGAVLTKFDPLRASNRYSSYGYDYYQYQYQYQYGYE